MSETRPAGTSPAAAARRLHELDVLRGFAVCGIMVVNAWQHTRARLPSAGRDAVDWGVENLLQGRFYPIFSFLFGLSFVLFLRSAAGRARHPRAVLLRRLAVLACFGALHQLVNPGEVLLPYAIFGAAVLLPASYLPRAAVAALGAAATAWAAQEGGGLILVPGLFLLGAALMRYAPPEQLLPPAFAVSAVLAVTLTTWWVRTAADPALFHRAVYPAAGLAAAAAYCTGLLLLLRTRARRALLAALAPLGRMALTNYLLSTAAILAALPLLTADPTRAGVLALSAVVLAAQIVLSRLWLRRFRYGPAEWLWRCLTWLERVPNRRVGSQSSTVPSSRNPSCDSPP
ncbi:DUF418 domain-containing protein [Streptosporangium sp. NPDC004379]|uniref:DUF418 domain-containing protein n=1 Tax=Streptosporangium sp. NPDC004379 TaxID=3366189 RepID=UPI0036D1D284